MNYTSTMSDNAVKISIAKLTFLPQMGSEYLDQADLESWNFAVPETVSISFIITKSDIQT